MNVVSKTIFIPIFHGHIARNVLLTDTFKILAAESNLKIVIFTYNFKKDYYQKIFARSNVIIEGIDEEALERNFWDRFFKPIFACFADSTRPVMVFKEMLAEDGNYLAYWLRRVGTYLIGNNAELREIIRWAYYRLVPPKKILAEHFEHYQPDAIFLADATFHIDNYLMRIAKERQIPAIGMLRSWDVLTSNKGTLRIKPRHLIVHNEFMKKMARQFGDIRKKAITIVGMPQFDSYFNNKPTERTSFFKKLGLDPTKRVILFALTGPRTAGINQDIITMISQAVSFGKLPSDLQILVRMHPNSNPEEFNQTPHTVFHRPEGLYFHQGRLSDMEFTEEWLQELSDTLYYSDVTINAQSTMTIDAVAFDRPVINLAFDGYEHLPYIQSVRRLYDIEHYRPILKTGGVRLVYNEAELTNWINNYLDNPNLDQAGRQRILEEQCWQFDGQSGRRAAETVLQFINLK